MSRKKKITIIAIILVIILMLIPIKVRLKDGGTVMYKAVLYSYIEYNIMSVSYTHLDVYKRQVLSTLRAR